MAELLETIDKIQAETANMKEAFKGEGANVRDLRMGARKKDPKYMQKLSEAARLLADVKQGRKPMFYLKEAMTTSDFPLLFGDIIDRQLLTGYEATPNTWSNYIREGTVPDFRTVSRHTMDGGEGRLDNVYKVGEKEEYKYRGLSEGRYQYSVEKYGNKFDFSWEVMINDDLGAFDNIPAKMGRAAARTEEWRATELFVDATGPHDSLYRTDHGPNDDQRNIITDNPSLSIEGLQTAMTVLGEMLDEDDEPIMVDHIHLVVPPALEVTAQNILNAIQLEIDGGGGGGTTNQVLHAQNWMSNRMTLHVNYYIPVIATTGDFGQDSWFLFADPNTNRPAAELGFLRGYRDPQLFRKAPNAMLVGANQQVDPMNGDFDSDNIEFKVRHVLGGAQMDFRATCASDGSGSE